MTKGHQPGIKHGRRSGGGFILIDAIMATRQLLSNGKMNIRIVERKKPLAVCAIHAYAK